MTTVGQAATGSLSTQLTLYMAGEAHTVSQIIPYIPHIGHYFRQGSYSEPSVCLVKRSTLIWE